MVPDFVEPYLDSLRELGHRDKTIETYEYDLKLFFEWMSTRYETVDLSKWRNLRRDDYDEYFQFQMDRKSSEAKIKRLAASLNGLISFYDLQDTIGHLKPIQAPIRELTDLDFITSHETKQLYAILVSKKGLTEHQIPMYRDFGVRNLSIVFLMRRYGLTLTEVHSINMQDISFTQNTIQVHSNKRAGNRTIRLDPEDKRTILSYYNAIPELFRPQTYTKQPLFVAYRPHSYSYQYNYDRGEPQRMSKETIKTMIERAVDRAGLRKYISAVQLRNTCILEYLKEDPPTDQALKYFGLSSRHALYRYKRYLKRKRG